MCVLALPSATLTFIAEGKLRFTEDFTAARESY